MKLDKIFSQVRDAIYGGAGANLSIGNPSQLGDVSVIPVARVVFSFGGGGGKSPAKARQNSKSKPAEDASQKSEPEEKSFGGGGGGAVKTEPVGIYILNKDKVKFYPIVSVREILTAFGIISVLLLKIYRLRRRRK